MIDLFLRADTLQALLDACPFLADGEGKAFDTAEFSFSPIGSITTEPGTYDDDGKQLTPPVMDERFHANLRCTEDVAALVSLDLQVTPGHPVRMWA